MIFESVFAVSSHAGDAKDESMVADANCGARTTLVEASESGENHQATRLPRRSSDKGEGSYSFQLVSSSFTQTLLESKSTFDLLEKFCC